MKRIMWKWEPDGDGGGKPSKYTVVGERVDAYELDRGPNRGEKVTEQMFQVHPVSRTDPRTFWQGAEDFYPTRSSCVAAAIERLKDHIQHLKHETYDTEVMVQNYIRRYKPYGKTP